MLAQSSAEWTTTIKFAIWWFRSFYEVKVLGRRESYLLPWKVSTWIIAILRMLSTSNKIRLFLEFLERWSSCQSASKQKWICFARNYKILRNLNFTFDIPVHTRVTFQGVFVYVSALANYFITVHSAY